MKTIEIGVVGVGHMGGLHAEKVALLAERGDVLDRRDGAGEPLVVLGPGHPALRGLLRRRAELVDRQFFE